MTDTLAPTRPPVARSLVAGVLMGLANLVPGVSGGTMILVMGLYERFIGAVARLSSGKPKAMDLVLLGLVGAGAVLAIVPLAGVMSDLVVTRRSLMYSLFIGMTLAGTPVLWRMAAPLAKGRAAVLVCLAIGLATMVSLAFLEDPQAREQARELREAEDFRPDASIGRDLAGGGLAMSAMILPGISGAYMLLLLGRYEHVTGRSVCSRTP
jgi:putative membrane protein